MTIFLNNGLKIESDCHEMRSDDVDILARQVSACAMVHTVMVGKTMYRDGRRMGEPH